MARYASTKQLDLIARLLNEKDVDPQDRRAIEADVANDLSGIGASQWIDFLFARKRLPRQQVLAVGVIERPRPSVPGFYLVDGHVFKVVATRDGERLYAKQSTARGLEYVPGAMNRIFADELLSPQQLAEQGVAQGFCIVCSTEFEDPTSKHVGIGPTCGRNQLGPDAYKALRLTVADRPDVVAFEAAKKAKAKEAREAKKREQAQLVLV